ncbi:MAG TPA: hypothetical protein VNO24_12990 [Blastocatellia bacterium]|nr:hypothetical protein [Blastocatellia bacterium]
MKKISLKAISIAAIALVLALTPRRVWHPGKEKQERSKEPGVHRERLLIAKRARQ